MFLSVIVPVYNREKTIETCVRSILSSSLGNELEVILVDDGSTDQSRNIIQMFAKQDDRVIAIYKENGGVSSARNAGIKKARGKYLTFVDSDDYVCGDVYAKCKQVAQNWSPDLMAFGFSIKTLQGIYPANYNKIEEDVLHDRTYLEEKIIPVMINVVTDRKYFIENYTWNKLYRRDMVVEHGICFDETRKKWEDRLFTVEYLVYAQSYYQLHDIGYVYDCGGGGGISLSGMFCPEILSIVLDSFRQYQKLFGHRYDMYAETSVEYYCSRLMELMLKEYSAAEETEALRESVDSFVSNEFSQALFARWNVENKSYWVKRVYTCIRTEDCAQLFKTLHAYAQIQRIRKRIEGLYCVRFAKRAWSWIKRKTMG